LPSAPQPATPDSWPPEIGLIDLNIAGQPVAAGAHHHRAVAV
jgi:hypothetical protein